jgi:ribosomal protein L7/L12
MTLKVQFNGTLLEMKDWLSEMPDNLAAVFHTRFEATTDPASAKALIGDARVVDWYRGLSEEQRRDAFVRAKPHMDAHAKISAIKAVRTVLGCGLKEGLFFVEQEFNGGAPLVV